MKIRFWSVAYWLYAVSLGVRHSGKIKLGSRVMYQGKAWMVNNGVRCGYWSLVDGDRKAVDAPCGECRRLRSANEWSHAFRFMYRWWMTSWHSIYVYQRTTGSE